MSTRVFTNRTPISHGRTASGSHSGDDSPEVDTLLPGLSALPAAVDQLEKVDSRAPVAGESAGHKKPKFQHALGHLPRLPILGRKEARELMRHPLAIRYESVAVARPQPHVRNLIGAVVVAGCRG